MYEVLACLYLFYFLVYVHGTTNDCLVETQHDYKHAIKQLSGNIDLIASVWCMFKHGLGQKYCTGPFKQFWSSVTGSEDGVVGNADARQSGALEEVKKLENRFTRGSRLNMVLISSI